jgi:hypothetical protein
MQGSHLCNHYLCIIHSIYETAEINAERKECHVYARFLRKAGLLVPLYCDKHTPACLLQHAALTEFETLLIQFFVWRTAHSIQHPTAPPTPRWHPYPTLEFELPLKFSRILPAKEFTMEDLVVQPKPSNCGKPELKCRFCSRIKSFKSLIAFWGHLVHQHYDDSSNQVFDKTIIETTILLEDIRRTANLWRTYWKECSSGGKGNETMDKLNQVEKPQFSWAIVLSWGLR